MFIYFLVTVKSRARGGGCCFFFFQLHVKVVKPPFSVAPQWHYGFSAVQMNSVQKRLQALCLAHHTLFQAAPLSPLSRKHILQIYRLSQDALTVPLLLFGLRESHCILGAAD